MEYKWTKKGLLVTITNTVYGMLEQGGVTGRKVLYNTAQCKRINLHRGENPNDNDFFYVLWQETEPVKVIRKGYRIR